MGVNGGIGHTIKKVDGANSVDGCEGASAPSTGKVAARTLHTQCVTHQHDYYGTNKKDNIGYDGK